ncbi:MAG: glycosyltransferase family 4 protein [Chloroflexi bacterium]|nr:glycosyltransferase family 4 protein [Chloroflexota bacterium]
MESRIARELKLRYAPVAVIFTDHKPEGALQFTSSPGLRARSFSAASWTRYNPAVKVTMIGNFGLHSKGTMGVRALPMAKALVRRGHAVSMVLPPWDEPELAGRAINVDGVRVRGLDIKTRPSGIEHAGVARALLKAALDERAEVVHAFKPKAYAGVVSQLLWGMKRAGLFPARLIVDTDDWEGAGGWNDLESFSSLQKQGVAWQERWCLRQCDAVTVASQTLRTLVWALGVAPGKVWYVPNGAVERPSAGGRDLRAELGLGAAPVVLLYTRFFEFEPQRVAGLWAQVRRSVPEARLLVVGAPLQEETPELQRMLGDDANAHFVGWVDKEALADYFAAADLAIDPLDDTLVNRARCSVKLVDLLMAGLPVVAESVGQVTEYIENGRSGVLVSPGDVGGFGRAVVELLRDEDERRRLGEAAAHRMRERFCWDRLVDNVERAYGVPAGA